MLGMNPVKDIKSLTAYDTKFKVHSGVAIIEADNLNREKLHKLFNEKHPDHKTTKAGKHTIYSWKMHKHEASGTFYDDRHIVMGSSAGIGVGSHSRGPAVDGTIARAHGWLSRRPSGSRAKS